MCEKTKCRSIYFFESIIYIYRFIEVKILKNLSRDKLF